MIRSVALLGFLTATTVAASAQQAININGQMIPLQCDQWKKGADGTWNSVGVIAVGGIKMSDLHLGGSSKEVLTLNEKCASH